MIFMILYQKIPLRTLLPNQLDPGMFSSVFNIIPIVFSWSLMGLYGFWWVFDGCWWVWWGCWLHGGCVGWVPSAPPQIHGFSLFLARKYTYRYPCPLSLAHICFLMFLTSFLSCFVWVWWFCMDFRSSLTDLVGLDAVCSPFNGCHFMILHGFWQGNPTMCTPIHSACLGYIF